MQEPIQISIQDAVMCLRICRPERKNALNMAMYSRLADAIEQASSDASVRVVCLLGSDGCFTAGNDLADFSALEAFDANMPTLRFMRALASCPKPVVVAVEGVAVGIGTTLLLHCDLVYAAANARFSMPFVNLGLCPEYASSYLLPRLAGYARAAEWLLLGEAFDAEEALRGGLINSIVDKPEQKALEQCLKLALQPPEAVRQAKKLLKAGIASPVDEAMEAELQQFAKGLAGPEFKEAVSAFFAKRSPDYSQFD